MIRRILPLVLAATTTAVARADELGTIRIATFNVNDVRAEHVADPDHPRLRALAAILQEIRPDIVLLNEIQFDGEDGTTARRFVEVFLATPQDGGAGPLEPLRMQVVALPSNTGVFSGFDLDRSGNADPSSTGRAYAGDSWGYGEFPGHYAMALLVSEGVEVDEAGIRTFQNFRWRDMPGALLPPGVDGEGDWYPAPALERMPLSSKSHWDVPVRLPSGRTVHVLCSHPTPPVFDGQEDRNGRRNHDEIRFWAEYLSGAGWIVDDAGVAGGLPADASFVVLGDLNADPEAGDSRDNPVGRMLLRHPRLTGVQAPAAEVAWAGLDPTDTARFRLRVDYVLPSNDLQVVAAQVVRWPQGIQGPSDHFPVVVTVLDER